MGAPNKLKEKADYITMRARPGLRSSLEIIRQGLDAITGPNGTRLTRKAATTTDAVHVAVMIARDLVVGRAAIADRQELNAVIAKLDAVAAATGGQFTLNQEFKAVFHRMEEEAAEKRERKQ